VLAEAAVVEAEAEAPDTSRSQLRLFHPGTSAFPEAAAEPAAVAVAVAAPTIRRRFREG